MASGRPKQYLPLHGRALIEWSLAPFLDAEWIDGVVLVLARHDNGFAQLPIARHPRIITTVGGGARADSVLAGLERSEEHTSELQSLIRISYAAFCLETKKITAYD